LSRPLVIAIDGPSGAGKSTVGRALAARLGFAFVDTGAMYRALALKALRSGVPPEDGGRLAELARRTLISLTGDGRGVTVDGEDVTVAIRAPEVSAAASRVSAHPAVRLEMVARQRAMGERGGVVLDGRDIGTAVFPQADVKFYVEADPACRARRRADEIRAAGTEVTADAVLREIRERDHADMTRSDSPLTRAADAIDIDTTDLAPDQVLERMLTIVEAKRRQT
jgi:cytidylate kinase